jgi:hypothetical protein
MRWMELRHENDCHSCNCFVDMTVICYTSPQTLIADRINAISWNASLLSTACPIPAQLRGSSAVPSDLAVVTILVLFQEVRRRAGVS